MTTLAPSAASRRALANPMPEQPPVTTATRPATRPLISAALLFSCCQFAAKKTFFSSVKACGASGPSSRPRPDCL